MSSKTKRINYAEIEEFRRASNRKQWAVIGTLGVTQALSLAVLALMALKPATVIAFDATGGPMVFKDTVRPGFEPDHVRVRHFCREFLERYVGIDSTRLEQDFAEALNMMTPLSRELVVKEGVQVERRRKYRDTWVRSHFPELEFRIEDFDPKAFDKDIHLFAWGRQEFNALQGRAESVSQFIFVKMVLRRQPVRELTPYGLLVKYIEYESFKEQQKLDAELLKVMRDE